MSTEPLALSRDNPVAGFGMSLLGTALIVGVVVVRLANAAIMLAWFDVDPATVDGAAIGLLPGFRLGLDAVMLVGAALVFAGLARQGRGASWWVLLLAVIPIPLLLWHGWNDPADLEQGSLWIASVIAAVALAHGASDNRLRALGVSIVLAGLAPVLIRAVTQVAWDIPSTIAWFDANREDALAMRGLEPGSSAALVFERRLRGAAPTGWFTTANLLASVMAAGASAWFAIAVASVRAKLASGVAGLAAFIALAMAAVVIASGSRGGIVVLVIGLCFVAASLWWPWWRRFGGPVAVALVILALLAAPLSTLLGDLPGTRSLVIRNGYVTGAAEVVSGAPLTGVGPAGFREAWLMVRAPESPEEIDSPHAMPWDWAAAIGVAALAWVGLVLAGLWWSTRHCHRSSREPDDTWPHWRITFPVAALVVGFGFTNTQMLEVMTMGTAVAVSRVLGWLAFIALATLLGWLWSRVETGITWGMCAAAVVLVIHAQVEMTIEQATTAPWLLAVLGLVAPVKTGRKNPGRSGGTVTAMVAAAVAAVLAVLVFVVGAIPAFSAQGRVSTHGMLVHSGSGNVTSGLVALGGRESATDGLLEAAAIRDDDRLRFLAAEQLLAGLGPAMAAQYPADEEHVETARQRVLTIAMDLFDRTGSVPAGQLAVTVLVSTGDPADLKEAVVVAEAVVARDPAGLWSNRYFADALWESGDQDVAIEVYRRVLDLDEARAIDPLRRLSQADRVLIERRVRGSP